MHSCYEGKSDNDSNIKFFIRKLLFKKAIGCSDACIFVSNAGLKSFLRSFKNLSKKRTYVVYNGIGTEKLERGRSNVPQRSKPIQILYVGRLHSVKGVTLLLDAIAAVKKEYSVCLTVVGNGPEWESLHRQAENLGILDIVKFAGQKTDVIPYLEDADIFVYPSVCEEVFGISIVEAMAFGLICIANRVGGIPEIIQNGVNGFLTDEKSSEGIADALRKVINMGKEEEISIRSAAKETAERFSIANTVDRLTEVLERTATSPKKNAKTH